MPPVTRAEAERRAQAMRDVEHDDSTSEEETGEGTSTRAGSLMETTVEGQSGIMYDNRELSPSSWEQAVLGIDGDFEVDLCRENEGYYAFQVVEKAGFAVRIGSSRSDYKTPACTCETFQETKTACRHIYWLLDQLTPFYPNETESTSLPLNKDGSVFPGSTTFERITKYGLEKRAEQLEWPFIRRSETETTGSSDDSSMSRKDQVRDILSIFDDEGAMPEDYRPDMYADIPEELNDPKDIYVRQDLEATIFRLSVFDDIFFQRLRKILGPDLCASVYFQKVRLEARKKLTELDALIKNGPSDETEYEPNVNWCANALRTSVARIQSSLHARAQLGRSARTDAVKALVYILQEVCNRNKNVYEEIDWEREAPPDEEETDQNLYQSLIGNPPSEMRGHFVIDVLWGLLDVARAFLPKFEELVKMIESNGAPPECIAQWERLLIQLGGGPSGSGGTSAGKRAGAGDDRGGQKRVAVGRERGGKKRMK
ncbi:MAG: hypothetical protein M1835_000936 [Candelina submexicana]|nr:MAG: hypothetical protein M1835_000936 [Candelina submexicana]